ncbi:MAG: CapA family protein [Leptospiraceae bacterium]|nr:CapA family protein [Leptospiraceae bacterium]
MMTLLRAGLPALLFFLMALLGCTTTTRQPDTEPINVAPSPLGIGPDDVTLVFAGDTNFIWGVEDLQRRRGMVYPLEDVMQLLSSADLAGVNLETAVTRTGTPINEKNYIFNSSPLLAGVLADVGVDVLMLANNHSMDMGGQGILDTIEFARRRGMLTPGAGTNVHEAALPAIITVKGMTVAIFSANDIGPQTNFATGNAPGTASISVVQSNVRNWCGFIDFCVVNLHWGMEYSPNPIAGQRKTAEALIKAGADAIIGHHPHIPQGIEVIDGKPVFYSVGNFLFGSVNFKQTHNLIVRLVLDKNTKQIKRSEVYVVDGVYRENGHRIRILNGAEAMPVWEEIFVQSKALGTRSYLAFGEDLKSMVVFPKPIPAEQQ